MRVRILGAMLLSIAASSVHSVVYAQNTQITAKLTAPISTKTSNAGDRFTAIVEEPKEIEGAILEGQITKIKAPARGMGKGKPEIVFQFETMTNKGLTNAIRANLTDVA